MNKNELRIKFKERRNNLSIERRLKAEEKALDFLLKLTDSHQYILSYSSFKDELSTHKINHHLAMQGKLLLPKITARGLEIFKVDSIEELDANSWGILEPKSKNLVDFSQISLSLIPALVFDSLNQRIGYGKGYYDRLLSQCKKCRAIGIGFEEQLYDSLLPQELHDVPLSGVFLF